MDFLLSFRLWDVMKKPTKSTPIKVEDLYLEKTHILNFLLLSVENKFWKYLQLQGIFFRFLITSYTITFHSKENVINTHDYINVVLDLIFLIDVVSALTYRLRCPEEKKQLRKDASPLSRIVWRNSLYRPRQIWMLVVDIVSLMPFELFRFLLPRNGYFHLIVHNLPLLRIYRIPAYYVDTFKRISLRVNELPALFIKTFMFWVLTSHFMTCLWYGIARFEAHSIRYNLPAQIYLKDQSPFQWYLVGIYFIQSGFANIGFGDLYPMTDLERLVMMFAAALGFSMLCGYLIAALSSVLAEKGRRLSVLRLRLSLMKVELDQKKVPDSVTKKIMKFYHSLWFTRKGIGAVNQMLNTLPEGIYSQVYYDIFLPALNASLLFRSCDEFSKRAIARSMEVHLYMSGDVILTRNEINTKMFYIRKGTIQIMSYQDDETQIMTFGAGTVFGQFSLILSLPAKSEVHAATFCEIHIISRRNLFVVLSDYPSAKEIVLSVHKNLLLNVLADRYEIDASADVVTENLLTTSSFYKVPLEASKLARDDICVVTTFPFVFMPDTIFMKVWHAVLVLIIVTICFFYPYCAAFLRKYPSRAEPFIIIVDLILILDIYLAFSTAFIKQNKCGLNIGASVSLYRAMIVSALALYPTRNVTHVVFLSPTVVLERAWYLFLAQVVNNVLITENFKGILFSNIRDIAGNRLTSIGTYVDLVSVMPIHYFLRDDNREKAVVLCIRCLEFYKIQMLFSAVECTVDMTMISLLRLTKYVLYFLFGGYAMGMIYFMQACYNIPCHKYSWYENSRIAKYAESPISVSLYFAILVMSGTGYGDVTVTDVTDITYVIAFCVIGVLLYIYLISEYSANLSLSRVPRQNFTELAERVSMFLISHKMLSSERIRVRQYLNLQWEKNMGYEFTNNHNLFYDTPSHLLFESSQYTKSRGLQKMEIFKGMGEGTLSAVLSYSYREVLPPHEVVIYAGEVCNTLLIIEEGCCEVTYGKDVSLKKIIQAGQDICTVELMLGLTALCHVRTLTHCTLLKVHKSHLRRAFALNPIASKELQDSIQEFKETPIVQEIQKSRPLRLHLTVRTTVQKSLYRFKFYRKQSGNKELRNPYAKLGLCQWIRYILRSTTILPYGKLLKRWELSRCVFAFSSAIIFPCLPYFQLENKTLYYVGWILDVTAWIDLYFRVHVCYYNKRNLLVSHPLWTCSHYIKGSFVLDFIFSFPFDRILYRPVYNSKGETFVSDTAINFLRILRVGQIYRIPATINNLGADNMTPPNLFWVLLMTLALTTVYLNLLTSLLVLFCCNYKIDSQNRYTVVFKDAVAKHMNHVLRSFNFTSKPSQLFLINYYWMAVTSFGVGFGDITAATKELMIYVIVVIIFSYLYFNYVTIIIASYLSSINMNLTIFQKRMNHLVKYLKGENVEPMLRDHIINHFEYVWKKNKGMKAQLVFFNFNLALRDDVMLYLYEETLLGITAFSQLNPSFFRVLSSRLDEINFQAGAAIYKKGDILSQLYIIHQGEVTLVGNDENQTMVLTRSRVFGHLENIPRGIATISAVATKNVTILGIPTLKLYQLLDDLKVGAAQNVFSDALVKSNETKLMEIDDALKFSAPKSIHWLVHTSYRFSKHILILYVVLSLFSANEVSYSLAFQTFHLKVFLGLIPIELVFVFKIFLGFHTGYVDEAGDFISDLQHIKTRYMRPTGFYLDCFTVLPFECFSLILPGGAERRYLATWLRVTRLLRLYNVWYFFNLKFDTLNVNMVRLKIIAVAVWTGTLLHQCSCAWYLVSCNRANCPDSYTWNHMWDCPRFKSDYLKCVYFIIVVLTTTGFGDITPHTLLEILYVIGLTYIAFFYTAIFIGQMVSTAEKSLFGKKNYEFDVEGLKTFLDVNDVSNESKKVILKYLDNLWGNEKGQQIPELLKDAPNYLKYEIKISTYGHHINTNPVFRHCSELFRKQLIISLRRTVLFPGNVIVHEGEVNRTAYFVHSGQVECKQLHETYKPNKIYSANSFFGLIQGIRKSVPHTKTFYARTVCVLLSLRLRDWDFLCDFCPDDINYIEEQISSNRVEIDA